MHGAEGERTREINKVWTAVLSPPAPGTGREKGSGTWGGRVAGNFTGPAGAAAAGSPREPRSDWLARRPGSRQTVESSLDLLRPSPTQPPAKGVRESEIRNVLFPFWGGGWNCQVK